MEVKECALKYNTSSSSSSSSLPAMGGPAGIRCIYIVYCMLIYMYIYIYIYCEKQKNKKQIGIMKEYIHIYTYDIPEHIENRKMN